MQLVTIARASETTDLSTRTIHKMLSDGRLSRYRLDAGRAVRVDLDELLALFREAA